MDPGSDFSKPPLLGQRRRRRRNVAAAKEISVRAPVVLTVLPELDDIFTLEEEWRENLKAFISERKDIFTLIASGFGKSLVLKIKV